MRLLRRTQRDERGVVVPLVAAATVSLFAMVALVVNLGQLRADRRVNKSTADLAARAAANKLQFGPWPGVCKAIDYLLGNARAFSAFDAGSQRWTNVPTTPTGAPSSTYATSPCAHTADVPFITPCLPDWPSTWARFFATAGGGRIHIEIQSGYKLPDSRFPEDTGRADTGDPLKGSCDNVAVIIRQQRRPLLNVVGGGDNRTTIRSVARLNAVVNLDYVAALQLLEQHRCNVLQTGGNGTRVIAQPFDTHPGIIQIDSAADDGSCPSPILNGQATSGGPAIVACSTQSPLLDCHSGTGTRESRIGIYALNFVRPPAHIATPYPSTYGDQPAVATPRSGRRLADLRYRANLAALDSHAKSLVTGNGGLPPGCGLVLLGSCVDATGKTWLVLQPLDCGNLGDFLSPVLHPLRANAQNIWFNCDLRVTSPRTLNATNVVITGQLRLDSELVLTNPRMVYVGGRDTADKIGVDLGGAGSILRVNRAGEASCADRSGPGHTTRFVLGKGAFKVSSGAELNLCQTTLFVASGYDRVPTSDNTDPCTLPCATYTGTIAAGSGAILDWSAPNEITGRIPTAEELATTNPFEDLALWTEAGGNNNGLTGGSDDNSLTGVFFLPNADSFTLSGNGAFPVSLSAQFIARTMKVTGNSLVNLVPNPEDSIFVYIYSVLLVR